MKKVLLIVILCLVVLGVLYIGSLEKPMTAQQVRQAVTHYRALHAMLNTEPVDFALALEHYRLHLAELVRRLDERTDLRLDGKIEDALLRGEQRQIPRIAIQIADKSLVRVFYRWIMLEGQSLSDPEVDASKAQARMHAAYGALEPTVVAGSRWIDDGGALPLRILHTFSTLSQDGKADRTALVSALTVDLQGVLVLALLEYIERIEAIQASDKMGALELMAAAKMFYGALYVDHALKDREGAIMMMGEFAKQPVKVNTTMMRKALESVFVGRIPELTPARFARPAAASEKSPDQA